MRAKQYNFVVFGVPLSCQVEFIPLPRSSLPQAAGSTFGQSFKACTTGNISQIGLHLVTATDTTATIKMYKITPGQTTTLSSLTPLLTCTGVGIFTESVETVAQITLCETLSVVKDEWYAFTVEGAAAGIPIATSAAIADSSGDLYLNDAKDGDGRSLAYSIQVKQSQVYTSADGKVWNRKLTTAFPSSPYDGAVSASQERWMVLDASSGEVFVSPTGGGGGPNSWSQPAPLIGDPTAVFNEGGRRLAYVANRVWCAVGKNNPTEADPSAKKAGFAFTTDNGSSWSRPSSGFEFGPAGGIDVAVKGTLVIAVGDGSTNVSNISVATIGQSIIGAPAFIGEVDSSYYGVAPGYSVAWVVVGSGGSPLMYTLDNGSEWKISPGDYSGFVGRAVVFNGHSTEPLWVAVGFSDDNKIYMTDDPSSEWESVVLGEFNKISDVAFHPDVGPSGTYVFTVLLDVENSTTTEWALAAWEPGNASWSLTNFSEEFTSAGPLGVSANLQLPLPLL